MSKVAERRRKESNPGKGNNISMRLVHKSQFIKYFISYGAIVFTAPWVLHVLSIMPCLLHMDSDSQLKNFCRYLVS